MAEYLKLFKTQAEHDAASEKPHISHIVENVCVEVEDTTEKRVVCKYNVTSTTTPTRIGYSSFVGNTFSSIEIDGVPQPSVVSGYTFNSTGEHVVKYTLKTATTIVMDTFYGCVNMTDVYIPNSVTTIGESAFYNCSGLTTINIPSGVTSIDEKAFVECHGVTSITVDSNNAVYDSRNDCNAIIETGSNTLVLGCKNTVIPNNVTVIGKYAFTYCSGLTSVEIPNSVTTIDTNAFGLCTGLVTIDLPDSVTTIGTSAFTRCRNVTSVTMGDNVTTIGNDAFSSCTALKRMNSSVNGIFNIPGSVTSIGKMAFNRCRYIVTLNLPNGLVNIGEDAFYECDGLTGITIPDSVTTIGIGAFSSCISLSSVTIGSGVTKIGQSAFASLASYRKLNKIVSNILVAPSVSDYTFYLAKNGGTLYVPVGSSGYENWMQNANYYLGKYGWTKVEQ